MVVLVVNLVLVEFAAWAETSCDARARKRQKTAMKDVEIDILV